MSVPPARSAPWAHAVARAVGRTATAKIAVLGLSGLLGLITSRVIIERFGTAAYAQYGLLGTLPALLPFADLGIAAVVINAVSGAEHPRSDPDVRRTVTTAVRVLAVMGLLIGLVSLGLFLAGLWGVLLGDGLLADGGELAAFLCMLTFGLALPLTVGQRILVGFGRTGTQVATQAVIAPTILVGVVVIAFAAPGSGALLPLLSFVAAALASVLCLAQSARLLGPALWRAAADVPRVRSVPGVPFLGIAWPMLVQMVALPVALQTDRILLSHVAGATEVAQFSLATQIFGLALQTVSAAGLALWPIFARARAEQDVRSPLALSAAFTGAGLMVAVVLAVAAPWIVAFAAGGRVVLGVPLLVAYVLFVGVQAAKYPLGMYMTDQRGLAFQVGPILAMVPLNLLLSWWLIGILGTAGTVVGSVVAVVICQVVPDAWYVSRDLARRRTARPAT